MKTCGEYIRKKMKDSTLSCGFIARELSLESSANVSDWRWDRRPVPQEHVRALAGLLRCDYATLNRKNGGKTTVSAPVVRSVKVAAKKAVAGATVVDWRKTSDEPCPSGKGHWRYSKASGVVYVNIAGSTSLPQKDVTHWAPFGRPLPPK